MGIDPYLLDRVYNSFNSLSPIPKEAWTDLVQNFREKHIRKKEHFIREGGWPTEIAYIVSGLFRVYYLSNSLDERIMVFRAEGDLLAAYSSFIQHTQSRYSIQALEDSRLFCLSFDTYVRLMTRHPSLQTVEAKYVRMLYLEKEKREIELLSKDAADCYETFLHRYPHLSSRLHQYHIAAYLGITPVALSRIRKRRTN